MIAVENDSVCFLGYFEEMPFGVRLAQAIQQLDARGIEFITRSPLHELHIRYIHTVRKQSAAMTKQLFERCCMCCNEQLHQLKLQL